MKLLASKNMGMAFTDSLTFDLSPSHFLSNNMCSNDRELVDITTLLLILNAAVFSHYIYSAGIDIPDTVLRFSSITL